MSEFSEAYRYVSECSGSWYDAEKELKDFSKKYPNAVFQLDVIWESVLSDEPSRDYFQNGKSQQAKVKIIFEKFDPKKLK